MNEKLEGIVIVSSFLLLISVLISNLSYKTGIPTLLIFLGVGMLAGSEGIGGIVFDNYSIAQGFGTITIALILFYGGLDTDIREMKGIILKSISISTFGVLITSVFVGYFISLFTKFSFVEGVMIGSIISPTDAVAIFATLKSKKMKLKYKLSQILELESGSNDIVSFFLMMTCIKILKKDPDVNFLSISLLFLKEMTIGALIGIILGRLMVFIVNNSNLINESLYPGIPLSSILFNYSITTFFHGNGFLSVYIAALIMGSSNLLHKQSLKKFFEILTWLLEIGMFLILGLLVYPKTMLKSSIIAFFISLFLIFAGRPLGIFLSLLFFKNSNSKQKIFLSWAGLRGAASIIFAIYPILNSIERSYEIFNIVFFIVIISTIIQGTSFYSFAKKLKLEDEQITESDMVEYNDERTEMIDLIISNNSEIIGTKIVDLGLPRDIIIISIERDDVFINPRGSTTLHAKDKLMIALAKKDDIEIVNKCFKL